MEEINHTLLPHICACCRCSVCWSRRRGISKVCRVSSSTWLHHAVRRPSAASIPPKICSIPPKICSREIHSMPWIGVQINKTCLMPLCCSIKNSSLLGTCFSYSPTLSLKKPASGFFSKKKNLFFQERIGSSVRRRTTVDSYPIQIPKYQCPIYLLYIAEKTNSTTTRFGWLISRNAALFSFTLLFKQPKSTMKMISITGLISVDHRWRSEDFYMDGAEQSCTSTIKFQHILKHQNLY